jgi:fructosamine-3-kinase
MRHRIARAAGVAPERIVALRAVGGGSICDAYRVDLDDGSRVFAKVAPHGDTEMLLAEVSGLRWLSEAGADVPTVLGSDRDVLVLSYHEPGAANPASARRLGHHLAVMHGAGADAFGSPPPGAPAVGRIGSARLPYGSDSDWPTFYAERRILPHLEASVALGRLGDADADALRRLCDVLPRLAGPEVPVARLHGDLWSGNVLWAADGMPRLIDPAAHGGHPETDLAMLALFGAPLLEEIIAGYERVARLPSAWRERIALHQLHPLLVHAELFGGGYGPRAAGIARQYLAGF